MMRPVNPPIVMLIPRADWMAREAAQHARVERPVRAWLERRARRQKHPVEDFLFTYYNFPPSRLLQWVPALGETLEVTAADRAARPIWQQPPFVHEDGRLWANAGLLTGKTRQLASWVTGLCAEMLRRPPMFRCFGLHEWAMVYRQTAEEVRHQGVALRLPPGELARFVESQALCCTHYDAFRFFTQEAAPRNAFSPTLESRQQMEQAGCLHANMDLYKWCAKLWPWVGSELITDAFDLALAGRILDMRASPYDLADLGCPPIRIETPEGREEYEAAQRALAGSARLLRQKLQLAGSRIARADGASPAAQ